MLKEKNLDFLINLGSYKPLYLISRIVVISIVAVLLIELSVFITNEDASQGKNKFLVYSITIVAFNSISEFNLLVNRIINKIERFRWNIYLRAIVILLISILIIYFWVKIAEKVFTEKNIIQHQGAQIVLIIGFLILVIHLLVIIISNLTQEWLNNRKVINELKQAKLLSDYNSLRDRLNPHFLFNNLSILKSLIHYSPQDAEIFTQNFTNVYRYVLKSHQEKTVTLEEEMKFLESYIALHKERIGEGLKVDIRVSEKALTKRIPPITMQLLVENAIKHNVASKSKPLHIDIIANDDSISIKNNLNKKETTYSTNTGLKTLQAQYKLISNLEIEIIEDDKRYTVKVPLLDIV